MKPVADREETTKTSNGYCNMQEEHSKSGETSDTYLCAISLCSSALKGFSRFTLLYLTADFPHPQNTRLKKVLICNRLLLLLVACKKKVLSPSVSFLIKIRAEKV